jgi:hypothetical protein
MQTLIKLLITAAILNAAYRGGMAYWTFYQLKDFSQELIRFSFQSQPAELHDRILEKAVELNVPLQPENISVRRDLNGRRTLADASYVQPVEFFPSYTYPVPLSFSVEATR